MQINENMVRAEEPKRKPKHCVQTWPCNGNDQCRDDCQNRCNGDGQCDSHLAPYLPKKYTCTYNCWAF